MRCEETRTYIFQKSVIIFSLLFVVAHAELPATLLSLLLERL